MSFYEIRRDLSGFLILPPLERTTESGRRVLHRWPFRAV